MSKLEEFKKIVNKYNYMGNIDELAKNVYKSASPDMLVGKTKEEVILNYVEPYLVGKGYGVGAPMVNIGAPINYRSKDSAFCIAYGTPETAALLLSDVLGYNCEPEDIKIITLSDYGAAGRHNDLCVQFKNDLFFFCEEQSSVCPNMPARMLIYYAYTLKDYLRTSGLNAKLYSSKLVKLPDPMFYVVDVTGKLADKYSLADAFTNSTYSLNLAVNVIKRNDHRSQSALKPFYMLVDYITQMRERRDTNNVRNEVIQLIKDCNCPEVIKYRLVEKSDEVMGALQEEIMLEDIMNARVEDAVEEAVKEAVKEVVKKAIELLQETGIPDNEIILRMTKKFNLPEEKIRGLI